MAHKVFIDGEAGTTGLRIRDQLAARGDIELVSVDPARRKELDARLETLSEADVAILCLPDAAAVEIVAAAHNLDTRIIDASTAHRVAEGWTYGFAEMAPGQREAIREAKYVANPGCYPTGAIALLRPLTDAGLIAPGTPISVHAVSGYSGGGKAMIEEFESGALSGGFVYGLSQTHKHLPEMTVYSGLDHMPIFVPSVGQFACGMIVQIGLPAMDPTSAEMVEPALRAAYADQPFVSVAAASEVEPRLDPQRLNGTNRLELSVHGDIAAGRLVLCATLDNLGKGASGAAVQNLNIMLGLPETAGL